MLAEETKPSIASGGPTERLVDAAAASMPAMVMRKFHNLRSTVEVAHEFYRVHGRGADQTVEFTRALTELASADTAASLTFELDARWALVEASFDAQIGRSLVTTGVLLDPNGEFLLDRIRRAPVASSRSALVGFQHGRCFYCRAPLDTDTWVNAHVDHVFPFSAMLTGSWQGPDLNGVWNLAVACAPCNGRKGARFPRPVERLGRLCERNEAILASPHPLRRTIELLVRTTWYRGPHRRPRTPRLLPVRRPVHPRGRWVHRPRDRADFEAAQGRSTLVERHGNADAHPGAGRWLRRGTRADNRTLPDYARRLRAGLTGLAVSSGGFGPSGEGLAAGWLPRSGGPAREGRRRTLGSRASLAIEAAPSTTPRRGAWGPEPPPNGRLVATPRSPVTRGPRGHDGAHAPAWICSQV